MKHMEILLQCMELKGYEGLEEEINKSKRETVVTHLSGSNKNKIIIKYIYHIQIINKLTNILRMKNQTVIVYTFFLMAILGTYKD